MNKLLSLIILIVGIALIVSGIRASNSISSDFSNLFTGLPTDKAIWMMVGGIVLALAGISGVLLRGSRNP